MKVRIPRSLSAVAFALVLSSTSPMSLVQTEPTRPHSQADLESQALQSLNDGYALLIDPTLDVSRLKLVGTVNESDRATVGVAARVAEIARFRSALAVYGTRIKAANVSLLDPKVEPTGDQLILRATESLRLVYEVGDRGPRPEDVAAQSLPREFVFEFSDGAWTLVFDRPLWPNSGATPPNAPKVTQPILAHTRRDDIDVGFGAKVLAKPLFASGTYRWLDAVYYAHTWANAGPSEGHGYNTAYDAYPVDCANFMSQALRAGGWTDIDGSQSDPSVWWYDDVYDQNSNTWSAADWLINFIYVSGRGYPLSAFTDLLLGDIMFADWAYNGTPGVAEHSMMLTAKTSNDFNDIKFTYHTTDRYDYPLSFIMASSPNSLYWGSRIQYTSNP